MVPKSQYNSAPNPWGGMMLYCYAKKLGSCLVLFCLALPANSMPADHLWVVATPEGWFPTALQACQANPRNAAYLTNIYVVVYANGYDASCKGTNAMGYDSTGNAASWRHVCPNSPTSYALNPFECADPKCT